MRRLPLLAVTLALVLAGCGGTKVKPVSPEDLQTRIAQSVEQQLGDSPTISCPVGLKAQVGATTTCSITGGTSPLLATAQVTNVNTVTGEVKIAVSIAPDPAVASQSPSPTDEPPTDAPAADASPTS